MKTLQTRILRLPRTTRYEIVSMPQTAWYWLDDYVRTRYPEGGYNALIADFGTKQTAPDQKETLSLSSLLSIAAQDHCARQLANLYNLANDNDPARSWICAETPEKCPEADVAGYIYSFPSVTRLFHFMPHATYLTTVWERRNYHKKPQKP